MLGKPKLIILMDLTSMYSLWIVAGIAAPDPLSVPGRQERLPHCGPGYREGGQPGGQETREPEGLVQQGAEDGAGEQDQGDAVHRAVLD